MSGLCTALREQTEQALWSAENVIESVPDCLWETLYGDMPVWKHIYHTLHSLDRWLINPSRFEEPAFHTPGLDDLDTPGDEPLTRQLLRDYFAAVREKSLCYLRQLTDRELAEHPPGCRWTRFALLLAQHRHLHTHMGMLMGFVVAETGLWPRVTGLEDAAPPAENDRYYNH